MKILVTGGAGFIGSHLSDALIHQGHEIHIIDNLLTGAMGNVHSEARFHEMDIRDEAVARLWERERFEVLFHLAAQMDVRLSVANPRYDADVNIQGLINLMEFGRLNGLKKVIFASTGGAIYGEPEQAPQSESHPLRPASPYGVSKLASEHYLHFYKSNYDIDSVSLRYANVYGPRQNPHGEAGVVAIFAERMLKNEPCIINGTGRQTRDFVYVKDVVKANLLALNAIQTGIYNVGTGVETDVITLFRMIRQFSLSSISEQYGDAKPGEQKRSVIGYSKIKNELGWIPQFDLKTGLPETLGWFKNRLSR